VCEQTGEVEGIDQAKEEGRGEGGAEEGGKERGGNGERCGLPRRQRDGGLKLIVCRWTCADECPICSVDAACLGE